MIPVIYEDSWLLIVNKPAGLLVIPTPKNERRTLTNILNEDLIKKDILYRLHPCHRLDRETSGLILYAKGKSIQKKMMQEFKQKRIKKKYIAFIQGLPHKKQGEIKNPIEGLSAITKYRVIEGRRNLSVVEARPITGRTNQIRIHFKQIGHPILGESKFAFRRDFKIKAKRLCLHAKDLEFIHPIKKKTVFITCELPSGMKELLQRNQ